MTSISLPELAIQLGIDCGHGNDITDALDHAREQGYTTVAIPHDKDGAPAGAPTVYRLQKTLWLSSWFNIEPEGMGSVLFKPTDANFDGSALFAVGNADDTRTKPFVLQGIQASNQGANDTTIVEGPFAGIRVTPKSARVAIRDCKLWRFCTGFQIEHSWILTLDNCYAGRAEFAGLRFVPGPSSNAITVIGGEFGGRFGVDVAGAVCRLQLIGTTIEGFSECGLQIAPEDGGRVRGLSLRDVYFETHADTAYRDVLAKGNAIGLCFEACKHNVKKGPRYEFDGTGSVRMRDCLQLNKTSEPMVRVNDTVDYFDIDESCRQYDANGEFIPMIYDDLRVPEPVPVDI